MRHELAVLLGTDANWTVMFTGSPSFLVHVSPPIVWDLLLFTHGLCHQCCQCPMMYEWEECWESKTCNAHREVIACEVSEEEQIQYEGMHFPFTSYGCCRP